MDASIIDSVPGYGATVNDTGELKVSADVPGSVTTTVSGTVQVNVASTTGQIETTPGPASSVNQSQIDVAATSGGTQIIASGARKGLLIANLDATKTVYVAFGSTPTTTEGFPVAPGTTLALPAGVTTSAEVKGITTSGTARVAFVEFK